MRVPIARYCRARSFLTWQFGYCRRDALRRSLNVIKFPRTVLIVEDEEIIRTSLREFLLEDGYIVFVADSVEAALAAARERDFHVAICDVQLPDGDGVALLRKLRQLNPALFGLIITAYATVENAVDAFKAGAFDYLVKPVIFSDLSHKLGRLFEYRELSLENQALRRELARLNEGDELIGSSKAIQELKEAIRKVAVTNSNALLVGESGTGKALVARMIHRWGPKRDERFIAFSCATRPVELLEATLFGAEGHATNGAVGDIPGHLRTAAEGTVFLDDIAQLPTAMQARLLRAMELQEATPLGGTKPYQTQARIVASTSHDLTTLVAERKFDEALFYRLNGVKLPIPALRERLDDIPELVEFFVAKHSRAMGQRVTGATSETIRLLMSGGWRGNVRQLDNAIERAVMMCEGPEIRPQDLPPDLQGVSQSLPDTDDLRSALRHYEKLHISRVLKGCPDKREAAKRLRLGLSSLYRKIEELQIDLD
ncbi:MAG: sigma-54-dependent Fis family transcriptional regulator [Planctomycetaceae bacterium]|nr:sigma-54-dependent Fis family transcriptional regulator [Planctomycetaceae bacterium]